MGIHISYGSGRAKCRICQSFIEKNEIDVRFSGYQMEKHYHKSCIDKEEVRYKLLVN